MIKIVEGSEYSAQKKTIMATKLGQDDRLRAVALLPADDPGNRKQYIIMQSEGGYFLRFDLSEVSVKKKNALGIRGMNLGRDDHVREIYLTGIREDEEDHILYKEKELYFSKIRIMSRNTKGVKVRR